VGTEEMLRCEHHQGVFLGAGEEWTYLGGAASNWRDVAVTEEWLAFIGHVGGGHSPMSATEARGQMASVLAACESAASGETIAIVD
jgi:hypothetical protein